MSAGGGPGFEIRVADQALDEDLAHCTAAGRSAIEKVPSAPSKEGIPRDWLRRCEAEGRDGTRLGGCVKLYTPQPAGVYEVAHRGLNR